MPPNHKPLCFRQDPPTSSWANPLIVEAFAPLLNPPRVPGSLYPESARLLALSVYAETGNQREASKASGIPQPTVNGWVHEESTLQLIDDLRSTIRYNCGWKLARKVQALIDGLEEDPTDDVVLRDGRIIQRRVPWKDRVIGTSILMDKWMLISGAISQSSALAQGLDKISKQVEALGSGLLDGGLPVGLHGGLPVGLPISSQAVSPPTNPPSPHLTPTTPSPNPPIPDPHQGETLVW